MQRRTEEVASLTDADVIELVNNTQLDAADQLLLPKAPPCTQRARTPSAIHPHHADLPAIPSASSGQRTRSVDAAAISHQPIIHHKRRHALHTQSVPMETSSSSGLFSQHPLPLRRKFTRVLIHDHRAVIAASRSRFSQRCGAADAK